ncbi:class I glutamine amidotransferase-like protein [Phellopilus nigrolimitatus]|nr:class I glutamine amidotransferase-like protein [Phellopilus nigrolimitatus]
MTSKVDEAPLRVGILLCKNTSSPSPTVQLLDTAAIDLFGMISPEFLLECGYPAHVAKLGQRFEYAYIAEEGPGTMAQLTSGLKCEVTNSLESAGKLDFLFIPGPLPSLSYAPSEAMKAFIRQKLTEVRAILGVCTGTFPLARSGVLSGRRATATRMFLPALRAEFPDVLWTEKRWEHDSGSGAGSDAEREAEIWTSGGIVNGIDMIAAYIKGAYPAEVSAALDDIGEVAERPQAYE